MLTAIKEIFYVKSNIRDCASTLFLVVLGPMLLTAMYFYNESIEVFGMNSSFIWFLFKFLLLIITLCLSLFTLVMTIYSITVICDIYFYIKNREKIIEKWYTFYKSDYKSKETKEMTNYFIDFDRKLAEKYI